MVPKTRITVGGSRRRVVMEATVDTGFDGDLCIPVDTGITLGLDLIDKKTVELADGSTRRELLFHGYAVFLGRRRNVQILLTDSEEALIGTNLLTGCKLSVDFTTFQINISR